MAVEAIDMNVIHRICNRHLDDLTACRFTDPFIREDGRVVCDCEEPCVMEGADEKHTAQDTQE